MAITDGFTNLEDYLARVQRMEVGVLAEDNRIDELINTRITTPTFYTSIMEQKRLLKDLRDYLQYVTDVTGDTGKLMSTRAMDNFLTSAERSKKTAKTLANIDRLNSRRVDQRLRLYERALERELNYTTAQIDEFFLNATASGRTKKQALAELVKAAGDKEGFVQGMRKKVKRVTKDSARREAQERAVAEYRKAAKPNEKWQWISVSSGVCPDCQPRAGKILPFDRWQQLGLPGTGRTICGASCRCQLVPVSVSDELFPDVKTFKFDRDKMVLATAGEARTLKSKAAQPPDK